MILAHNSAETSLLIFPLARCHWSFLQAHHQWGLRIESCEGGYVFIIALWVLLVITYSGWCCDTEYVRSLDAVCSDQQCHYLMEQPGFENHIMLAQKSFFFCCTCYFCSTIEPETWMMQNPTEQNFIDPHQLEILVLNNYWEHLCNEVTHLVIAIKDLMPGCDLPEVHESNMRHI